MGYNAIKPFAKVIVNNLTTIKALEEEVESNIFYKSVSCFKREDKAN